VRAITGRADPNFSTEGDYTAFLEFEDGAAATLVFNGYGFFDAAELTWNIGEGGKRLVEAEAYSGKARLKGAVDQDFKYANPRASEERTGRSGQSFFGITIVACERGAVRQSPQGLFVYTEAGREEIPCPPDTGRSAELDELSQAVAQDRPVFPDGRWGMASLEVCLAMLQSSNERREITLSHQVACA